MGRLQPWDVSWRGPWHTPRNAPGNYTMRRCIGNVSGTHHGMQHDPHTVLMARAMGCSIGYDHGAPWVRPWEVVTMEISKVNALQGAMIYTMGDHGLHAMSSWHMSWCAE